MDNSILKKRKYNINTDILRDSLLTKFSKIILRNRYLVDSDSSFQDLFGRVASYYGKDELHAQRMYEYISLGWFMPATPVLSNGGTKRGFPISCFTNEVSDNLNGIIGKWTENAWMASRGGGIGTYWGNVRSMGEKVYGRGYSSGILPFLKVQDSMTLAISQGSLRRGSAAVYLDVNHPEIEEFIDIRRHTGGDLNRKTMNLHNGVIITNDFMEKMLSDDVIELKSPKDGSIMSKVKARDIWIKILSARMETGEPYILFIDNVNDQLPDVYKMNGLNVKTSNLCSEITLATGFDYNGKDRSGVCCLGSINFEKIIEMEVEAAKQGKLFEELFEQFVYDLIAFLNLVLDDFFDEASGKLGFESAVYSAYQERSIGLGVMGWHSYLQKKGISIESEEALHINNKMFGLLKKCADKASFKLAELDGACPDALRCGLMERNAHKLAIAPTATIAAITGTSQSIEPIIGNTYTHSGIDGSNVIINHNLEKDLEKYNQNNPEVWRSIRYNRGSVQHLKTIPQEMKDVYKTAHEIQQSKLVKLAADRQKYICQAQSLNFFLKSDVTKTELHQLHVEMWRKKIKSCYYLRSEPSHDATIPQFEEEKTSAVQLEIKFDYSKSDKKNENNNECDVCQ